jgi:diacylglycerol kinase family enzyme/membrane-associated phospholipid phosphatase
MTKRSRRRLFGALAVRDQAVFDAVASRHSPVGDAVLPRLTRLADHSVLWMLVSGGLWATGDRRLRRAAQRGISAIAVTSFVANQVAKRAAQRTRPSRALIPLARLAHRIPTSSSFPSGHSASAAAFAVGVGREVPLLAAPLAGLAALVGFSRVYTGVHFPGDVVAGFALGTGLGLATQAALPTYQDDVECTPVVHVDAHPDGRGIVAVVNPESGGGRGGEIADFVERELPAAEVRRLPAGADLVAALRDAARTAEVLAVAGGDGSINAGATVALEAGLPLLPLCGGTLNHFAADTGVDKPEEAIGAVRSGTGMWVDVGVVEGENYREIFLNTLSFGSYPSFVKRRERWEKRIGKPLASCYAVWHVLRREQAVLAEIDGKRGRVALIFVGVGAYEPAGFVPRFRPRLDSGVLDVRLLDSGPRYSGTRLLAGALSGVLTRSGVFRAQRQEGLEIDRHAAGLIARDGEVGDAPAAFTVSVQRRALFVYAPEPT